MPATDTITRTPLLDSIRKPVVDELASVDQLIISELTSKVPLIQEITQHIIKSGGKRLRPLLVILSAKACGYEKGTEHHELAAIIEFVHTATLLHDDVVDTSHLRRGQETANAIWGNQASVLVGDFLYSRAFQILARRSNVPVMKVLANTTNSIAEGEVQQLMNAHNPDINEKQYHEVIYNKTAKLFESASEIGALLNKNDSSIIKNMAIYGLELGLAFQIIDDILDYTASTKTIGKNIGDDLAEGKITLPLIYALNNSSSEDAKIIRQAIEKSSLKKLDIILKILEKTNAIEYAFQKAKQHAEKAHTALQILPESHYKTALKNLIAFAINRSY